MLDQDLYWDILRIDSTSGHERALAEYLIERLKRPDNTVTPYEVGDGTLNLLVSWGTPRLLYCTHLDTVPPYIAPSRKGDVFYGRGTCDAKGQLAAMWSACVSLAESGKTDFGLLLLAGEETGSFGAKAFRALGQTYDYVVVGEPTDNHMVSASKGTKAFSLTFSGRACHSGYPEAGESAVMHFHHFLSDLEQHALPVDPQMGETTWNIGKLVSDNPQNILSPALSCRLYFRTTAASDSLVTPLVAELAARHHARVEAHGGDTPMAYLTLPGLPTKTVAFGSDAPQLSCCRQRMLLGAGSILVAHRDEEQVSLAELEQAVKNYKLIYTQLL